MRCSFGSPYGFCVCIYMISLWALYGGSALCKGHGCNLVCYNNVVKWMIYVSMEAGRSSEADISLSKLLPGDMCIENL